MGGMASAWVAPGASSTAAFVALVAIVSALLVLGARRAGAGSAEGPEGARRWGTGAVFFVVAVLVVSGGYVLSGLPARGGAAFVVFFAASNLTAVVLAVSPVGARFAALPIVFLIAPQALRIPLELVLHAWADAGTIPVQMTFEGHNFDIVTGLFALGLAVYGFRRPLPRPLVWAFNLVGSALLVAVMAIALLSSPLPVKSYDGAPLLLALHLPYAWIVPMCVAPALFGHIVVFRWLRAPASVPRTVG